MNTSDVYSVDISRFAASIRNSQKNTLGIVNSTAVSIHVSDDGGRDHGCQEYEFAKMNHLTLL